MKYSLFLLETTFYPQNTIVGEFRTSLLKECCIHLDDYDTLEEAKLAQTQYELKTIILPSY